jgi:hypothetical protein
MTIKDYEIPEDMENYEVSEDEMRYRLAERGYRMMRRRKGAAEYWVMFAPTNDDGQWFGRGGFNPLPFLIPVLLSVSQAPFGASATLPLGQSCRPHSSIHLSTNKDQLL